MYFLNAILWHLCTIQLGGLNITIHNVIYVQFKNYHLKRKSKYEDKV